MRISKVILTREDKTIILQGMIHMGPVRLYQKIKDEMREAIKNGYMVFFEGVSNYISLPCAKNELDIIEGFRLWWNFYYVIAKAINGTRDLIIHPGKAICADITIQEIAHLLNGILDQEDINIWLSLSKKLFKGKNVVHKLKGYSLADILFTNKCLGNEYMAWRNIYRRKMAPILLDYRNKLVVTKIRDCNALVHYGQTHIKGITALLQEDGWEVKERRWLYLDQFV